MTLSIHLHTITLWLLAAAGGLFILGPLLTLATGWWLELGAVMLWSIAWVAALVVLLVAIGSML